MLVEVRERVLQDGVHLVVRRHVRGSQRPLDRREPVACFAHRADRPAVDIGTPVLPAIRTTGCGRRAHVGSCRRIRVRRAHVGTCPSPRALRVLLGTCPSPRARRAHVGIRIHTGTHPPPPERFAGRVERAAGLAAADLRTALVDDFFAALDLRAADLPDVADLRTGVAGFAADLAAGLAADLAGGFAADFVAGLAAGFAADFAGFAAGFAVDFAVLRAGFVVGFAADDADAVAARFAAGFAAPFAAGFAVDRAARFAGVVAVVRVEPVDRAVRDAAVRAAAPAGSPVGAGLAAAGGGGGTVP